MARFAGRPLTLGGEELEIPPLSLGQIRKLSVEIAAMSQLSASNQITPEVMDMFVNVVHQAISRNYPEKTKDWVEECLDLGNMMEVVDAVMNVSGFIKRAQAGEQAGRLTGTGSTPTS